MRRLLLGSTLALVVGCTSTSDRVDDSDVLVPDSDRADTDRTDTDEPGGGETDTDASGTDGVETDPPDTDPVDTDPDTDTDTTDADTDPADTDLPPDPLAGPRFVSGARITVEVWDAAGAEALARLIDTQLGVPCEVIEAEPGQLRCVPVDDGERVTRYLDDACTQPVYVSPSAACLDTGHLQLSAESRAVCGSAAATTVFALPTRAVPGSWWQRSGGGSCVPAAVDAGATVYTFSPLSSQPIAPQDLVAFRVEERVGPDDVGVRVLLGDDGTQLTVGLAGPDGPCTPELLVGGWRCVPDRRATRTQVSWFGDATCTATRLAVEPGNAACGDPLVVVQDPGTPAPEVWTVGPRWLGSLYDAARGCREVIESRELWEVGATSPSPSTWARLTLPLTGSGDVVGRPWTTASGTPLLPPADAPFLRVASGEPCAPARTASGEVVCLPVAARAIVEVSAFYADAACTDRVTLMGQQPTARWVVVAGAGCADGAQLVIGSLEEAGTTHVGDLYLKNGPSCSYASPTPGGTSWRHTVDVDPVVALPVLTRRAVP